MSILKFSDKDRLASRIMPDGWYPMEVVKVGDAQKSSSGASFNFPTNLRISEGEWAGKELELFFNTKTKNPSVMGTLQLLPHAYILHLAAATADCEVADVPDELDTAALAGGKFDGYIVKTIQDGVTLNIITQFAPAGKANLAGGTDVF